MNKIIFFDRDGVINQHFMREGIPVQPDKVEDFKLVPGISELCHDLKTRGFTLLVATNQPDLARGLTTRELMNEFHNIILKQLPITEIFICPHDNHHKCECRKPGPGMLLQGLAKYGGDAKQAVMIGDRWRDIEAATNAGMRSVFVDYNYQESKSVNATWMVKNVKEIASLVHLFG